MSLVSAAKYHARRFLGSVERRGLFRTLGASPGAAKRELDSWLGGRHYCPSPYYTWLDRRFDRRFSVDTAGIIRLTEFQADPQFPELSSSGQEVSYGPSPSVVFASALERIHVDWKKFVFIDFGCGKGKALLLAAKLPFKRIIGLELVSALVQAAESNWQRYTGKKKCTDCLIVCKDAREFVIPNDPAVYYFYNPFNKTVLRHILEHISRSLAVEFRESYVVFLNPEYDDVLKEYTFLEPIARTSLYSVHRAVRAG